MSKKTNKIENLKDTLESLKENKNELLKDKFAPEKDHYHHRDAEEEKKLEDLKISPVEKSASFENVHEQLDHHEKKILNLSPQHH